MVPHMEHMAQPLNLTPQMHAAPIHGVTTGACVALCQWHQPMMAAPVQPGMEYYSPMFCPQPLQPGEYWQHVSPALGPVEPAAPPGYVPGPYAPLDNPVPQPDAT
jgi:hypothetical protein